MRNLLIASFAALPLIACTGSPETPAPAETAWVFQDNAVDLRATSCPEGVSYTRAGELDITATPIDLGDNIDPAKHLPRATFAGGWHLTSEDPRFGGLSGLDTFASGNLLAVTDEGAFVWINMDEDGAPQSAHLTDMLANDGQVIGEKREKDAEGLALQDGLALVSLERNHRILAFDLENCGANARAADVAMLGDHISGMTRTMEDNGGVEGLAIHPVTGELTIGVETSDLGAPIARLMSNRIPNIVFQIADGREPRITGLDSLGDHLFIVRRDFQRGYGNTILIQRAQNGYTETLIELDPNVTVDNFEAIAAVETETGIRFWLISDNNFSPNQRTLLFAFDVKL